MKNRRFFIGILTILFLAVQISFCWVEDVRADEKVSKESQEYILKNYNDINDNGIKNLSNKEMGKLIVTLVETGYTPYEFGKYDLVKELHSRDKKYSLPKQEGLKKYTPSSKKIISTRKVGIGMAIIFVVLIIGRSITPKEAFN